MISTDVNQNQIEETWAPLITRLTICATKSERDALIDEMLGVSKANVVCFLNAHACNLAATDPDFYDVLCESDFLLRDGVGVELHLLIRGEQPGINLNGTDLIPSLIGAAAGRGAVALYGTRIEHANSAKRILAKRGISVEVLDGFRPDEDYIESAKTTRPLLIVLGMGMPKQEILSKKLKNELKDSPVLIVNGGAIIDFIAGRYPRAPEWVRRIRLESLYRLSREPLRLWKRNVGSLLFLRRSIVSTLKIKTNKK